MTNKRIFNLLRLVPIFLATLFVFSCCSTKKNIYKKHKANNYYLRQRDDKPKWNSSKYNSTTYKFKYRKGTLRTPYKK